MDLRNKTICDLSTGDTADADYMVSQLRRYGAKYMIGMINSYPSGIGEQDTAILTVAEKNTWLNHGDVIKTLGGTSEYIGTEPAALGRNVCEFIYSEAGLYVWHDLWRAGLSCSQVSL